MKRMSQFATVQQAARRAPRTSSLQRGRRRRRWFVAATDVVALQFAIESGPADAEHLARQYLVSLDLRKDPLDRGALNVFQIGGAKFTSITREPLPIEPPALNFRMGDGGRQIVDFDDSLITECDRTLQAVFQ